MPVYHAYYAGPEGDYWQWTGEATSETEAARIAAQAAGNGGVPGSWTVIKGRPQIVEVRREVVWHTGRSWTPPMQAPGPESSP